MISRPFALASSSSFEFGLLPRASGVYKGAGPGGQNRNPGSRSKRRNAGVRDNWGGRKMPRTGSSLILGLAMAAAFSALATAATAQQQPVPLKVANIRGNIYWTQGGAGGNTGIIVGQSGVIVVDTKTTVDSSKEVQAEIAKITPKPIDTAIVTHSDGDHVNGLAGFPAGLTIISQENCKKEMEASPGTRNAAPQDRLPTKTIAKDETMTIDGVRVRLLHWAPAHTSGDLVIYLPVQKIVFAGDLLVTNRPDTNIHVD